MTAAAIGVLAFTAWWMLTLTRNISDGPLASPIVGVALLAASTVLALLGLRAPDADRGNTPVKPQPAALLKASPRNPPKSPRAQPRPAINARPRALAIDALAGRAPPPRPVKDGLFEDSGIINVDSAGAALDSPQGAGDPRLMAFMEALPGMNNIDLSASLEEILGLEFEIEEGAPPAAPQQRDRRGPDSGEAAFVIFDPEERGGSVLHAEGDLDALWEGGESPFS